MPLALPPSAPASSTEADEPPVQRHVASPSTGTTSAMVSEPISMVQRAASGEDQVEDVDLRQLALEIYPLIRRMLAIERERMLGRRM